MRNEKVTKWNLIIFAVGSFVVSVVLASYLSDRVFGASVPTSLDVPMPLMALVAIMPYVFSQTLFKENVWSQWRQEQTTDLKVQVVVVNLLQAFTYAIFGWAIFFKELRERGFI